MKLSKTLVHSLREYPAEVEMDSEKILLKAGLTTKVENGMYGFTPLGYNFLENIKKIIENKSKKIGGHKVFIPNVNNFLYASEKNKRKFMLNSNCDNITFLNFLKQNINSYKQLPLFFYETNIENNYKSKNNLGIMCGTPIVKEYFYMILGEEKEQVNKEKLLTFYKNIFEIMNLTYDVVQDDAEESVKFIIYNNMGDSNIVTCKNCNYGNEFNRALSVAEENIEKDLEKLKKVETPNIKTIEELSEFFKVPYKKLVKTIIYYCNNDFTIAVMVRGDRDVDESRVIKKLGNIEKLELADEDIVKQVTNSEIGFAGPINLQADKILVDEEITKMNNFMVGANETGYHYENVNYDRDFKGIVGQFRKIDKNSRCISCGDKLQITQGFVIGEINKIQENIIKDQSATFIDDRGKNKPFTVYKGFIDIYKIISWAIEQNKDELGIVWPMEVAAFKVIITIANVKNQDQLEMGEKIYNRLVYNGINTILDDRKERAGVKFKDADLWGIPIRITVGKNIKENNVEIKLRNSKDKKEIPINQLEQNIKTLLGMA
ncbi:proline--tRNA ligase [Clostridium botulinum]|nr:proline--tRNA ligase [Clostridium botulinum]